MLGILFLLAAETATAQLYLTPQVRPPAEWRNGYRALPTATADPAFFISQRSRLTLDYSQQKTLLKFSLQDVRVWGDEEQQKDVPSAAVHEAWAEVPLSEVFSLKLGRQELVYNDDRLLGNVEWAQQARSHDAALLKARLGTWSIDAGGAYNQEKEQFSQRTYTLNNYKVLGFAWVKKALMDHTTLSGLYITDSFQSRDTLDEVLFRHTYGLDLTYKKEPLQLNGALYRQSGTDVSRSALEAYLGVAELLYTIKPFKLAAGMTYLSGSSGQNSKLRTFNTLYATNHKYYGHMDHFINLPADTRNGGLQNGYVKVHYSGHSRYNLGIDYHYFALAQHLPATAHLPATTKKYLGSELDASLLYRHSESVSFQLGYSTLFAGTSMEAIRGGNAATYADWGWLMVNIQPKILLKAFDPEM